MTSPTREETGSPLGRIARLLDAIDVPGAFATSTTTSASGLRIAVKDVGQLAWPLRRSDAQRLIAVARPARYGLRDETKLDARVRHTWEIPATRVTVEQKSWRRIVDPVLTRVRRELGLPEGVRVRAALHNLLVYQPGQFFRAHQDSEKTNDMIGTLVVILPSTFTGGALVVEHDRQRRTFRGAARKLTFVSFYADCHHQVQPVKTGYRVALTYNLLVEGSGRAPAAPTGARLDALVTSVDAHFRAPGSARFGGVKPSDVPDRLVYLLDHQYTRRTLGWGRLKRADAARAAALREVASQLDCEIALALADVHEQWSSEDDGFGYHSLWGDHRDWGVDQDDGDQGEDGDDAIRRNDNEGPAAPRSDRCGCRASALDRRRRPAHEKRGGHSRSRRVLHPRFSRFPAVRIRARRLHGQLGQRGRPLVPPGRRRALAAIEELRHPREDRAGLGRR